MSVTLGSLLTQDLKALEELNLLPNDIDVEDMPSQPAQERGSQQEPETLTRSQRNGRTGGLSWFEELLEGSRLGKRHSTRRGHGVGADGSTIVEWEVSEYVDNGTQQLENQGQPVSASTGSKRKIDDVAQGEKGDDVTMNE